MTNAERPNSTRWSPTTRSPKDVPVGPIRPRGIASPPFNYKKEIKVALSGEYQDHILDITHTNVPEAAERFVSKYLTTVKHLGFDLEHRPTFRVGQKANVSLLQFAPLLISPLEHRKHHPVLLYALYHDKGKIPEVLQQVLQDHSLQKYGVGIRGDLKHLKYLNLSATAQDSFIELGPIAHAAGLVDRPGIGLKALIEATMGVEVTCYKTKSLTMTNWELLELNLAQLKYASMDAFAAIEVYSRLNS